MTIKSAHEPWTSEEESIIRKYYPTEGQKVIQRLSTAIPLSVFFYRIRRMGLKFGTPERPHFSSRYPTWTDEEVNTIKEYFSTEGVKCMARLNEPSQKMNLATFYRRIKKLGISRNKREIVVNEDWETRFDKLIKERDSLQCQVCGKTKEQSSECCVHRIDYNDLNNDPENLTTVCNDCFDIVQKDRDNWQFYFRMLKNRLKLPKLPTDDPSTASSAENS